ncbi:MAG: TonB-dependent receptor plug domain-containing protein [Gemmatimonadota bacterium]
MSRTRSLAFMFLLAIVPASAHAQQVDSAAFSALRPDGNNVSALRTNVFLGFGNQPARTVFVTIAGLVGLNLTFDPGLSELDARVTVNPHDRSAAVALQEIARQVSLQVLVSLRGNIILRRAVPQSVADRAPIADTVNWDPQLLPGMAVQATRSERLEFERATNASAIALSAAVLRAAPTFIEPDLLKSIQMMPGIEARSDWSAGFNVRGGEADQSLILIDGYPIYNPFHLGGVFSTFIDPMVGNVELHTGTLPSQYGGRLSGVLDVGSARPTTSERHGTIETSLVSTSASMGRTFSDGDGEWMIAARRTYADAFVDLFKPNAFPYHFQDVHGHLALRGENGTRLSVTGYAGEDVVAGGTGTNGNHGLWRNNIIGATVSRPFTPAAAGSVLGDSTVGEQRLSYTGFQARLALPNYQSRAFNTVSDVRANGTVTRYAGTATTTVGYEVANQALSYLADTPLESFGDFLPIDSLSNAPRSAALYGNHRWRPATSLLLDVGGRFESAEGITGLGLSPRVSLKYFVTNNLALTAGAGRYTQWVHSLGREEEPLQPLQFWVSSARGSKASAVRDAVVGLERWVTPGRLLHVSAFYKKYDALLVPNSVNDPRVFDDEFLPVRGTSYGLDILLRQFEGGPFSGWMAYSYAMNNRVDAAGHQYAPTQDRRHNLNLVGSWQLDSYTFGARMNLASGFPNTPVLGGFARDFYDPATGKWVIDRNNDQYFTGAKNSARLPWYERVDVSLSRPGRIFGFATRPYLSVVNIFNSQNPAGYVYSVDSRVNRGSFPNLPFVPTLGITIAY